MSKLAIKAENISKQYRLGEVGTGTISHDLNRFWNKIRGKEDPYLTIGTVNNRAVKSDSDYVWSLKDINFEINQGDAVGIIGRNGAGKSTLLKLLSKVTKPTTGSFKVNGRIASLLEVGTGFNPEMTGRENIYLNGAILGMRKYEIDRKFDEIVDFSGVERYIDTPVKRYSSGMYVRLAFAVAAHLESEILIVDEVLAVGDAEFQKKCLGKMGDVSKGEGRTVLFVSHNMAAVSSICTHGILLSNGRLSSQGSMSKIVTDYLTLGTESVASISDFTKFKFYNSFFNPISFSLLHNDKVIFGTIQNDSNVMIDFEFNLLKVVPDFNFGFAITDINEQILFISLHTDQEPEHRQSLQEGINKFQVHLPKNLFNEGEYAVHFIASLHFKEWIFEANYNAPKLNFTIEGGLSKSEFWISKRAGILAPIIKYNTL